MEFIELVYTVILVKFMVYMWVSLIVGVKVIIVMDSVKSACIADNMGSVQNSCFDISSKLAFI